MERDPRDKWSIAAIKYANHTAGMHFFERATMRFFDSRVLRHVYQGPGGIYFITSEQFHGSDGRSEPRKYTVREFNPITGDCFTAGDYHHFGTLSKEQARHDARVMARTAKIVAVV